MISVEGRPDKQPMLRLHLGNVPASTAGFLACATIAEVALTFVIGVTAGLR
jgi:hypothetical protein